MHKFSPGTIPNPYQWTNPIKINIFFGEKMTCMHVLGFEEVKARSSLMLAIVSSN